VGAAQNRGDFNTAQGAGAPLPRRLVAEVDHFDALAFHQFLKMQRAAGTKTYRIAMAVDGRGRLNERDSLIGSNA
jgi:hypothetical protein